jgi:UDP-glucose 4-epimerase
MEVTVFGAAGFVGRNLLDELAETEHTVRACDVVEPDTAPGDATFQQTDITDEDAVEDAVAGSDAVVHLAAHQLPESLEEPKLNAEINVVGTLSILDAAREHDVETVVFPSASSILGAVDGTAADEETPVAPRSPYGVAKHAGEEYLQVYNRLYDLDSLVFRFFNVYGPYQHPDSGAFVPVVLSRLANGDGVYVTGDGQQTRDFVFVRDITSFIVEGIESDVRNEIVNMGHGEQVALLDAIHVIADVLDMEPDIEYREQRDDEIGDFCASTTKCERLFDRKPDTDFREGIERTYEWMRDAGIVED